MRSIVKPTQCAAPNCKKSFHLRCATFGSPSRTGCRCSSACACSSSRLERDPPPLAEAEVSEARRLLEWMEGRHFLFLGYRHYRLERGASSDRLVAEPRTSLGILRGAKARASAPARTVARTGTRTAAPNTDKANSMASVHRATYLDYVGVKSFGARGEVSGEHRFLGLWTSTAYHLSPREIPVLRKKVERVIGHFGLDPQSHDAKAVLHVLDTYPRDELFQAPFEGSHPHRPWGRQSVRAAHGARARQTRSLAALLFAAHLRAARSLQHRSAPAHRTDRARGLRR